MKSSKVLKTDIFITRLGRRLTDIEIVCVCAEHNHTKTFMNDEIGAMAFMWTCAKVQTTEFNKAMNAIRKHKHTHAHFSSNAKLFLYSDNEYIE